MRPIVIVLEDNLFLRPKLEHSLNAAGYEPRFVTGGERFETALGDDPVGLLANFGSAKLDMKTLIPRAREAMGDAFPIVAYGPHVDKELKVTAEKLGCTEMVPNGLVAHDAARVIGLHVKNA